VIEHTLEALRPLLSGVGFGIATVADFAQLPLYPEEAQHAQALWPRRRCDFWMGRSAARRALSDLALVDRTLPDRTIVAGPVRADQRWPTFPPGTVGSVSHSGEIAVSIVGSAARFRSLGIDLELRPLPSSAARLVLNAGEMNWLNEGKRTCAEAFSAKEAAFKALDPLLDGGAPPLRQIQLAPANGGFEVRWPAHPQMQPFVSIHHLRGGILAWTAIR
jgi:enterobactin synthetase component D